MIQLAASSARLAQAGVDMSLSTLILSILALVVSVTALGWQFVSWWKSGPAVGTDTLSGMVIDQPEHPEVLILVVNSRGRLPITVEQWGFVIKDTLYGPAGWTSGPEVLHRMEPDLEARWVLDYREARQWLSQNYPNERHYWDLVPYVRRGSGKRVYGRKVVRIWEQGHYGRDPRISAWWRRFLPGHERVKTRHGEGWERLPKRP